LKPRSAFTLIELLIVVAIIAILAAIAVPNFLEAQTRSKVSRAKSDMRSVAVAIEAYTLDNTNQYPAPGYPSWNLPHGLGPAIPSDQVYQANGMTTPIAYITSIPKDPFGRQKNLPGELASTTTDYFYATMAFSHNTDTHAYFPWRTSYQFDNPPDPQGNTTPYNWPMWNLQSRGPDQYMKAFTNETAVPQFYQYDSTNGTISIGNIVRVGP
jgi:prepilin-type N-terminal cleavage/methylation domain-containing protein